MAAGSMPQLVLTFRNPPSLLSLSLVMVEVGVEAKWPKGSVVMGKGSHKVVAHCITDMGSWERGRGILFIKFILRGIGAMD